MKDNISKLNNCYGCGICVPVCPKNIIKLCENNDGFYSPVIIDQDNCIECHLCLDVCAFNHEKIALSEAKPLAYAAWSNNNNVRLRCSSGGIGFEIGKYCINQGYQACGVKYNPTSRRAEHYIASTVQEFMPSVGSKYIPSNTNPAFKDIDRTKKYLITGTPCQIDSFRRYIKKFKAEDNFILLDFFCHGVPSLLLWDKYLNEVEQIVGKSTFVSWRNKTTGWHDSWAISTDIDNESADWHNSYNLQVKEKKHAYQSRLSEGDLFYKFFLGNYCLNDCCYKKCKYKMCSSSADIRIGDLWGTSYSSEEKGVSALLAVTDKGKSIVEGLKNDIIIRLENKDIITEGQMRQNVKKPWVRSKILRALKGPSSLEMISHKWIRLYNILVLPNRVINRIKKLFK